MTLRNMSSKRRASASSVSSKGGATLRKAATIVNKLSTHRALEDVLWVESAVPDSADASVEVLGDMRREVCEAQDRGECIKSVLLEELGVL